MRKRERARRLLLQALYSWLLSGNDIGDTERDFLAAHDDLATVDLTYFGQMLHAIPQTIGELDTSFAPFLDRPIERLAPIELTILRIATYEFLHRPEIPPRVVINEALELAKAFGGTDGHKFVNGVLDKMLKTRCHAHA